MKQPNLSLPITHKIAQALRREAKRTKRSQAFIVRQILEKELVSRLTAA